MVIVVTNSKLCKDNFYNRIEDIAKAHPYLIILREKHLSFEEYKDMYLKCKEICGKYNVPVAVNSKIEVARDVSSKYLTVSFSDFKEKHSTLKDFDLAVSIHSIEEAIEAERQGASFVIAGHIFDTDCKKGLDPRGLDFLKKVCDSIKIPVYAIGGIKKEYVNDVMDCGAAGVCVMSEFMTCDNVTDSVTKFNELAQC